MGCIPFTMGWIESSLIAKKSSPCLLTDASHDACAAIRTRCDSKSSLFAMRTKGSIASTRISVYQPYPGLCRGKLLVRTPDNHNDYVHRCSSEASWYLWGRSSFLPGSDMNQLWLHFRSHKGLDECRRARCEAQVGVGVYIILNQSFSQSKMLSRTKYRSIVRPRHTIKASNVSSLVRFICEIWRKIWLHRQ